MPPSVDLNLSVHHTSLSVADLDAQRTWYQTALGLRNVVEEYELEAPAVRTAVLESDNGVRLELIERAGSTRHRTYVDPLDAAASQGYGHWALTVGNLDDAFGLITASGGTAVWPPAPAVQPGARFAYVKDPEDNLIELIELPT